MNEHEHGHDDEGHEHHHVFDWETELLAMREAATHYYDHQFDWRGHAPPPGFAGPRYFPPTPEWRLAARLDDGTPTAGQQVQIATSTGQLRDMQIAGDLVFEAEDAEHRLTAFHSHGSDGSPVSSCLSAMRPPARRRTARADTSRCPSKATTEGR